VPAFKKLGPGDQIDNVLVLEPQWTLVSGTSGWRGSPEGSASINLYGGADRLTASDAGGGVVRGYQYSNLIPAARSYGALKRSAPITASVKFVYMTNEDRTLVQRSDTRWGYEHWKTVMGLYDYYGRQDADYVTASYDYYCLYFNKDSKNVVQFISPAWTVVAPLEMTASYTIESWVKPFLTSSADQNFTIASMNSIFWFGITGSTGKLVMSSSAGAVTASSGPTMGEWNHVAVRWNGATGTGSFTINMSDAGGFTAAALPAQGATARCFTVGNTYSSSLAGSETTMGSGAGNLKRSFHGLIGETRLWYLYRSDGQLSSSMRMSLTGTAVGITGSIICARFTDGPLATFPTMDLLFGTSYTAPTGIGSGTVDAAAMEQITKNASSFRYPWGWLRSFDDRRGPVWHPNDNLGFYPAKRLAGPPVCNPVAMGNMRAGSTGVTGSGYASVSRMLVTTIPVGMYGRQIVPNSVRLTCNAFSDVDFGLTRTLIDDGRGGLYLSGSSCHEYAPTYPDTSTELDVALGSYGALPSNAWLCEETTGSLTSSIGSNYLVSTDEAGGIWPSYRYLGPGSSGSDFAVRMQGGAFLGPGFNGGLSLMDIAAPDDMVFTWVARVEEELAPGEDMWIVDKNESGQGYRVFYTNSAGITSVGLLLQNAINGTFSVSITVPASVLLQWHTGLAVVDRATNTAYVLISTLGGTVYSSAPLDITLLGTMTTSATAPFVVGTSQDASWQLAALYAGKEAGTITSNVSGALASFANVIRSTRHLTSGGGRSSVEWNKVGNVFYNEGLITIKDPALLDFAADWTDFATDKPADLLQLEFRGQTRIPVKTIVARIERGELNCSLNPSYYTPQEDGFRAIRHPSASLYVTTVGLYNSDRELVGVARLAEPLRIRPRDRLAIKIRMDF
jgi:hypothetical protein